jgi:hypothetical protein
VAHPYDRIAGLARTSFGYRLFTAMRYLRSTDEVERVYTTDPAAYPVGGRKLKRDTAWSRQVFGAGEPYFANDERGIRAAFDDADKILREAGGYSAADLETALALAPLAAEALAT